MEQPDDNAQLGRLRNLRSFGWLILAAVVVSCVYVPSLRQRFDFIDDGNLVYPDGPMPLSQRLELLWDRIDANSKHLGPFRPVLWAHWTVFAEINQGSDLAWRLTRLVWCVFATVMLLWLMRELNIARAAAIIAAAIAMWNPYRNEIWTSNTLGEGVAMPYALFALIAARRASRSPRAWLWDIAGMLSVLAALGCKNTFAALIPAQIYLRFAVDGLPLREGWRQHRLRALMLGLTIIAPAAHYVWFKMHWHAGQYVTTGPSFAQLRRLLGGYQGAISLDFLGAGLGLVFFVVIRANRQRLGGIRWVAAARDAVSTPWQSHRAALGAAILLIGAGIGIYMPLDMLAGRYVMPGIWGVDILLGLLFTQFLAVSIAPTKRLAWGVLCVGLLAVAMANMGKQDKLLARTRMLWETLEWVEGNVPSGETIAWRSGSDGRFELNVEEGIHFAWHLQARKKSNVQIVLIDERQQQVKRVELLGGESSAALSISGSVVTHDSSSRELCRFASSYWGGWRKYECVVVRANATQHYALAAPSK